MSLSPRAWLLMFSIAAIWGASFLSNRVALQEVGVFTTVAFRVTGAALVLWVFLAWSRQTLPRDPRFWAGAMLIGVLNTALPFCLIVWGQQHIPSGLASILNASTAVFGVLVAALVFRDERLTLRKGLGLGLGLLGVATAIGVETLARLDLTSLAQLAVLGAALAYGISAAVARSVLRTVAPEVATAVTLTGAALTVLPLALVLEGWPSLSYAPQTWAALGYLAIVASALAYLLYFRALQIAGAGNVSLVTLLVAPVAIVLGALVFRESLPHHAYAGFALLATGLLVMDGRLGGMLYRAGSRRKTP